MLCITNNSIKHNGEVLSISQRSSITGASPSSCLMSYLVHSLIGFLPLCRYAVGVFYSSSKLYFRNLEKYLYVSESNVCCFLFFFLQLKVQFSIPRYFYWCREDDEHHLIVRYRARLILFEWYSLNFSVYLGAQPQNPLFKVYLTLPNRRGCCHSNKNLFNHPVTPPWFIVPSPFTQQMFWVSSTVLWPILNSRAIGLMSRVFANGPGDWDSIPGWVIPKAQKMVLDSSLLNTQHYKVLFTNPSARAGYDTRLIFKRSLTGFEFRVFLLLD